MTVRSLVNFWRSIFLHNAIEWKDLAIASVTGAFFLVLGFIIFRRLEKRLDEVL